VPAPVITLTDVGIGSDGTVAVAAPSRTCSPEASDGAGRGIWPFAASPSPCSRVRPSGSSVETARASPHSSSWSPALCFRRGLRRGHGGRGPLIEITGGFVDDLSVRDQRLPDAGLHGMTRKEIDARFEDIIDFAEIADFIDTPYKHLSSGMKVRIASPSSRG